MKIKCFLIGVALLLVGSSSIYAQRQLTMDEAIEISIERSPELKKSALNLDRYQKLLNAQKASLKSQFALDINPFEYSNKRYFDNRLSEWYTNESLSSSGTLSITQPIVWTNTTVSLNNTFGWQNNNSTIDGSGTNNNQAFSNSLYLSLRQPLFSYNKYKLELESIEMDYENATISYALTRLRLEQQITSQFYAVYMAQQNLGISKEELENAQQNYDIIKEKVQLDLVPRSELFQAELNLSTAESSLENSTVSLESSKDQFKVILGLPLNEDISTYAQIEENSVYVDANMAIEHALTNRLELRQREITDKLSEFSLTQIKDNGKFKGNVALSVGIMGDNRDLRNVYESPTSSPTVAISFSVPIFDWGARRDRINAQKIKMEMEQIDKEQELIDIEIDVVKTCRNLKNLVLQIEIAKKSVENAQQTYDLNSEKYRAGEITGMEMNQFQSQLSSQKISLAQKMVNYKIELLNLKVITLYDFENNKPISPMLMYGTESMIEYQKYKNKRK